MAALRLVALLPFAVNRGIASLLGRLISRLPGEARRVTDTNLRLCYPDLDENQRRQLARLSLVESSKNTFEIALFWRHPDQGLRRIVAIDGDAPLRQAVADGKPIMILAPHQGCWEVLNFWLASEFGLHAMFAPSGLPEVDQLIRTGREHFGSTMYPTTARGVAGLVRAMKKGALTAILPDQVPDRRSGVHAPFFGQPAYTGTLASKLIRQTGAVTFLAWARRLPGTQGFEIRVRQATPVSADADLEAALTAMNADIARLINEDPAQYLWSYKRFRRPPAGMDSPYSQ
ncbi:lipid A biosynthesis lauroyl acyltransferase [Alcanivorax hongdengensis A-11-3]|uniref:Lipid A biosynthesis lauroyl acyltransferase n=1 Tax=Alcanivorax hongdengensis A-11-3 TaxID=1177179 RepID=L0WGF5_9GAMM|nr:lipid A biosynthesis lauroyl acyltransferase [Alcanivorax hongdengensis A-11-3]